MGGKRNSLWGGLFPSKQKKSSRTSSRQQSLRPTDATKVHVDTIQQFSDEFVKIPAVQNATELEEDEFGVGDAFFCYLNIIQELLGENPAYEGKTEEEIDATIEEIEKYTMRKMFKNIFPEWASQYDNNLYKKSLELDWILPEHLDIPSSNRNEPMWEFAIKALRDTDECMSPVEKLNCLIETITIIVNVLDLCSTSTSAVGADDSLPIIIYVVIKA